MNDPNTIVTLPKQLQTDWTIVSSVIGDVVDCLERESVFASGHLKMRLEQLIIFLQQTPRCEEVLANPDALAIFLPMLTDRSVSDNNRTQTAPDRGIVESAVRQGVDRISRNDVYRRNWLQLFWYPGLVALVALIVCIFLSISVAPQFEALAIEMTQGIAPQNDAGEVRLPWQSKIVFSIAAILRQCWWMIFAGIGIGTWAGVSANSKGRKEATHLGWWDDKTISVRGAIAVWADHLSSLMRAGLNQTDAFTVASQRALKKNLRQLSSVLAKRDQATRSGEQRPYFPLRKYAMIDHALSETDPNAKLEALDEVAFYYRNRDQQVSTWWISWVSTGLLWSMGLVVIGILIPIYQVTQSLIFFQSQIGN